MGYFSMVGEKIGGKVVGSKKKKGSKKWNGVGRRCKYEGKF
jgi:hypothetical protein